MSFSSIIYAQKALFVSSGSSTSDQISSGGVLQLSRVTASSFQVPYPLSQKAYLNAANESYLLVHTPVDLTLDWHTTNGANERAVGLVTNGTTGVFANMRMEKNFYESVTMDGSDAVGAVGAQTVLGFAQGQLVSYGLSARVGSLVESSATFNCLTSFVYPTASGNQIPAVSYQSGTQLTGLFALPPASSQYDPYAANPADRLSALGAKDLILTFPAGTPYANVFTGGSACYLQSMQLSFAVPREEIKPIGYAFPTARAVRYPIEFTLSADAIVSRYQADQLQRIQCLGSGVVAHIRCKIPCSDALSFFVRAHGLQLENQSFVGSIGARDTVSFRWKGIVSDPLSTTSNLWFTSYGGTQAYVLDHIDTITGVDANGVFSYSTQEVYKETILENTFSQ